MLFSKRIPHSSRASSIPTSLHPYIPNIPTSQHLNHLARVSRGARVLITWRETIRADLSPCTQAPHVLRSNLNSTTISNQVGSSRDADKCRGGDTPECSRRVAIVWPRAYGNGSRRRSRASPSESPSVRASGATIPRLRSAGVSAFLGM